ncbi:hypothetical protein IP88_10985 [alpha proteobacterium AAP81b]|nr:hypothetical protein IP88_10985 [alpha proteobacterium AAP81b]
MVVALLTASGAGATTYYGSWTVGTTTAVYSLTTNGALGILHSADLLDGTATVTRGPDQASFVHGNNVRSGGEGLYAVGRTLFFNSNSDNLFLLGNNVNVANNSIFTGICFGSLGASCGGYQPARSVLVAYAYEQNFEYTPYSGIVTVGIATVPDPAVWMTLVTGLAAVGAALRRRRAAVG